MHAGFLVGKFEGKIPLGRPRHGREDNIKMVLQEVWRGMYWKALVHKNESWRSLVNAIMNLRIPLIAVCSESHTKHEYAVWAERRIYEEFIWSFYLLLGVTVVPFQSHQANIHRVIHKSLRDFLTRLRNNQDRHGRKEHINR